MDADGIRGVVGARGCARNRTGWHQAGTRGAHPYPRQRHRRNAAAPSRVRRFAFGFSPLKDYRGDVRIEERPNGSLIIWTVTCTSRIPGLAKSVRKKLDSVYTRLAAALAQEAERVQSSKRSAEGPRCQGRRLWRRSSYAGYRRTRFGCSANRRRGAVGRRRGKLQGTRHSRHDRQGHGPARADSGRSARAESPAEGQHRRTHQRPDRGDREERARSVEWRRPIRAIGATSWCSSARSSSPSSGGTSATAGPTG